MPVRSSYIQGTPNWIDLSTSDHGAAKEFYGELFGWTFDDQPMPEGVYSMALKSDGLVGAISVLPPTSPRRMLRRYGTPTSPSMTSMPRWRASTQQVARP